MAVLKTHISWTNSTWNPTTGCTRVTAECDRCYAKALFGRGIFGPRPFEEVATHPERLRQAGGFAAPVTGADGRPAPRMVFVNSMSDLMHDAIPDAFRDRVYDAMEALPLTVFQILTKRPLTLERYLDGRYAGRGVPPHLWHGVSAGINRAARRLDVLRRLKDRLGPFTAFVSVEPLLERPDGLDFRHLDWVLVGGESPNALGAARPMDPDWARLALDRAGGAGAARWFKQWGTWDNNPLYRAAPAGRHLDRVAWAIAHGETQARILPNPRGGRPTVEGEKGGATLDGGVFHELPPAFHALRATLPHRPAFALTPG